MLTFDALTQKSDQLRAHFEALGATHISADILQPADILLDLYGENIRNRAYIVQDPLHGEMMLRPDFTVPIVQAHLQNRSASARYTYQGTVFRKQHYSTAERPNEYIQVGLEIFDQDAPLEADVDVFCTIHDALDTSRLRAAIGDIGIISAAVDALHTSQTRKAALMRHLWRPQRFRALLHQFGQDNPLSQEHIKLLQAADPFEGVKAHLGLRSKAEILTRLQSLKEQQQEPPIPHTQIELLDMILCVSQQAPIALEQLKDIAVDLPQITPALERMQARLNKLSDRGIDISALEFEGSYGRTSLEYYNGFVFGFYAEGLSSSLPVAAGGRYDALTKQMAQAMGAPETVAAVGGMVRPDLLLEIDVC